MVATVEPRVEVDDRIAADATLERAVAAATAFLKQHVEDEAAPVVIRWRVLTANPLALDLSMVDPVALGSSETHRTFSSRELTDTYSRESGMLRALGDLLRARSDKQMAKIDGYVRALNRVFAVPTETSSGSEE